MPKKQGKAVMGAELAMPTSPKKKHTAEVDKRMVMFNAKKGMGMTKGMCKCGSGMSKAECTCKMGKGAGNAMIGAREDAQRWSDAAPDMARANAKKPMVIEQTPKGNIMGRTTSARTMGSKGTQMGKSALPMPRPPGGGRIPAPRPNPVPKPTPKPDVPSPRPPVPGRKPNPKAPAPFPGGNQRIPMGKGQGAYIDGKPTPMTKGKGKKPEWYTLESIDPEGAKDMALKVSKRK